MAISYPLSRAAFWEAIRFAARPEFVLLQSKKQSQDAGGNTLTAFFGAPKWSVAVVTEGGHHNRNLATEADIKHLDGRDGTFLAYDIRRPFPASDPDGSIVAGSTVQVRTKGTNNRSISLKGLPAGYQITKGDKLSIVYASTRYFLVEVMESAAANGSGNTDEFEIQPTMPIGIAINDSVVLNRPPGKFKIVAGSYRPASGRGNIADGVGFSMISVP